MRHRQPELHFEASADPGLGDAKLDPAMLRVVEMDYEGDDDRSTARIPAPARTAPTGTAALRQRQARALPPSRIAFRRSSRGRSRSAAPVSVPIVARNCAVADAWATVFMVLGADKGVSVVRKCGLDAVFRLRDDDDLVRGVGSEPLFLNDQ